MVEIKGCGSVPFLSWKALMDMGAAEEDTEVVGRLESIKPGHCCALIYTSGTTGEPKAVMVSHDNIIYVANTMFGLLQKSCGLAATAEEERVLSYLPLSHVAGLMLGLSGLIDVGGLTKTSTAVFF